MIHKERIVTIVIGSAFVLFALSLWPQYQKQKPLTKGDSAQAVLAQLAYVSPDAQLSLVTEPNDGLKVVQDAITGASKSLDLVIYELEDPTLQADLVRAQQRGVKVRVIMQNVNTFGRHPNQEAYDFLKSYDVPVIWAQKYFALTHQKTLIVDGSSAWIMTFNLNPKYYASGRDFGLIDQDPDDVAAIMATFESDWKGSQVSADSSHDLVWSPGSADTLLALINTASHSLDIYNEEMAEPRITAALEHAAARGVAVRVDMTYATNWKPALTELVKAGVSVRTYASTARLYIHAKVIIADQKTAFVGSENFSAQSLNANRELGVLISRPDILSSLEKTFANDWIGARQFVAQ